MKVPLRVLKIVVLWPALLGSFVLATIALALAPPAMTLPLFLAAVMMLAGLAAGRLEARAVGFLAGSRGASDGERQVLAPVQAGLSDIGVERLDVQVRLRQRPSASPAVVIGRRSLVVTPTLTEALYRGWVTNDQAVALVGHAVAAHHARRPRCELAVMAATTPWRGVIAAFRGVGATFSWLPLVRSAWALRWVVGLICVVQSINEGRAAGGLLGGAVMGLTYAVPAADRALARRAEQVGDRFLAERGLGVVFLGLLDRGGPPVALERRHRLQGSAPVPVLPRQPLLQLVRN